jgi:hypothetical protein
MTPFDPNDDIESFYPPQEKLSDGALGIPFDPNNHSVEVYIVTKKSTNQQWRLPDVGAYHRFARANEIRYEPVEQDWFVRRDDTELEEYAGQVIIFITSLILVYEFLPTF